MSLSYLILCLPYATFKDDKIDDWHDFVGGNFTQNKQKTNGTLIHRVGLNYVYYNPPKETIILQIQTFKIMDFQLCNLIQLG